MLELEKIFKLWKEQKSSSQLSCKIDVVPENPGLVKKMNHFYNLPISKDEQYIINNSTVEESDIKDLQFRLKRKLRYSELKILELTSDHGIMIREDDFQP